MWPRLLVRRPRSKRSSVRSTRCPRRSRLTRSPTCLLSPMAAAKAAPSLSMAAGWWESSPPATSTGSCRSPCRAGPRRLRAARRRDSNLGRAVNSADCRGDQSPPTLASMSRLRPGRRTAAVIAILLLLVVAGSDFFIADFWVSHPMLTAIVSALAVVLLSVAVIEVVLNRRSERRWRILAQSALIELAEAANTSWTSLATALGLQGATERSPDSVRVALASDVKGPKVSQQIETA